MPSPRPDHIWVIMPALNAEGTLTQAVGDIFRVCGPVSLVVVNDGSNDATENTAKIAGAVVVNHETNKGFGASVKTGVRFALERGAENFLVIGADNQRAPEDILKLFAVFAENKYDIVTGSKFLESRQPMPFLRKIGNRGVNFAFNLLYGARHSDVTSGFRVFNKKVAKNLEGLHDRYPFDADLCALAKLRGWRVKEVPVKVFYHSASSRMKHIGWIGLSILTVLLKRRLSGFPPRQ